MRTTLAISDLHTSFLGILPKIERYARGFFSGTRCASKLQDQLAEVAAMAWKWFCRLAECGKDAAKFPIVFARFVCRAVKSGRRLCRQGRFRDVMNARTQSQHGFRVESLPQSTRVSHDELYGEVDGQRKLDVFEERLTDNTVTPVPDQAAFRIDFPAWLATLTARERRLIRAMARNERTQDLSRQFQLSPGRISQLRRDFHQDWTRFCGDAPSA
jgi:hypothetical protein